VPYEDVLSLPSAHVISVDDIEKALLGDRQAQAFIRHYAKDERTRWKKLVVEFRPDPFEGRSLFTGRGVDTHPSADTWHPRRGNSELFREYERILGKLGLSENIQGGDVQRISVPANATPPLAQVKGITGKLRAKFEIHDGYRAIPILVCPREVPEWALSDERIREYVLHAFAGIAAKPKTSRFRRAHRRAAEAVAVIYLYFRAMLAVESIVDVLGFDDEGAVNNRVAMHKRHAARFFSSEGCPCRANKSKGSAARTWRPAA
jgi:hypothetical protein